MINKTINCSEINKKNLIKSDKQFVHTISLLILFNYYKFKNFIILFIYISHIYKFISEETLYVHVHQFYLTYFENNYFYILNFTFYIILLYYFMLYII